MEKINKKAYEARLKKIKKPTSDEAKAQIDGSFNKLDEQRKEGFLQLKEVQKIKQRSLISQRKRLSEKYGANHPKVQRIEAKINFNEGFIKDINVEKDKASIDPITSVKDAWIVHGRVLDKYLKGIKGLTISLSDEKGKTIPEVKYDCSDELGYFKLIYPSDEEMKYELLYLMISKGETDILFRDPDPLTLKVGEMDYREIILSDSDKACAPPPEENERNSPNSPSDKTWSIQGQITDQRKLPYGGVNVNIYDKEEMIDEKIGTTTTKKEGIYQFKFESKKFPALFEKQPKVFVKVIDQTGETIYNSRKSFKVAAGENIVFNITIKR